MIDTFKADSNMRERKTITAETFFIVWFTGEDVTSLDIVSVLTFSSRCYEIIKEGDVMTNNGYKEIMLTT